MNCNFCNDLLFLPSILNIISVSFLSLNVVQLIFFYLLFPREFL